MLLLKFVYNVKTALATHDDVVGADLLYTCTDLHPDHTPFSAGVVTHCINLIITTLGLFHDRAVWDVK